MHLRMKQMDGLHIYILRGGESCAVSSYVNHHMAHQTAANPSYSKIFPQIILNVRIDEISDLRSIIVADFQFSTSDHHHKSPS